MVTQLYAGLGDVNDLETNHYRPLIERQELRSYGIEQGLIRLGSVWVAVGPTLLHSLDSSRPLQ